MFDVVVIGGGIAGLATAYELQRLGASYIVLEASARAGGVILSEQVDNFTIDAGPDALLVQKPDGIRLCQELGLGDRLVPTKRPRVAYIQRAGTLHPLPASSVLGIPTRFGPFAGTRLFSWPGKLRMAAELFVPARLDDQDESIGAFMARRFGREAVDYLAEPLLAGIHAGDVDRLSVRSLFPRFTEAERAYGSLLRAFWKQARQRERSPDPDGAFRSLPGGLSELVHALVAALPPSAVRVGAPVTRLISSHDGAFSVEAESVPALNARAVICTTPAYVTSTLVSQVDPELSRACAEIPYASTGTVALAFPRSAVAHPLNGSGFVVPRVESNAILAASWLSSKWPHRAPDDRVLLRTFVGGARDPEGLQQPDAALISRSLAVLRPLLGITGNPLLSRVYRWMRASAQHEVGHLARLTTIERCLSRHPGLFVTGSGFRGVGIPDCVADGRATAKQVMTWLRDQHRVPA